MRPTRRLLALALPLALAACLGDDPVGPEMPDIETTVFAPSLGVDLANSTETLSGLWYRNVTVGTGDAPASGDSVYVTYGVYLTNGTLFEEGEFGFRLNQRDVIQGFDEGVQGMRVGGRRQLIVPPLLAYGANELHNADTGVTAPPWSVLVFTVVVDSVSNGVQ